MARTVSLSQQRENRKRELRKETASGDTGSTLTQLAPPITSSRPQSDPKLATLGPAIQETGKHTELPYPQSSDGNEAFEATKMTCR
eukprot:747664-Hanusia_phi.AAC.3